MTRPSSWGGSARPSSDGAGSSEGSGPRRLSGPGADSRLSTNWTIGEERLSEAPHFITKPSDLHAAKRPPTARKTSRNGSSRAARLKRGACRWRYSASSSVPQDAGHLGQALASSSTGCRQLGHCLAIEAKDSRRRAARQRLGALEVL